MVKYSIVIPVRDGFEMTKNCIDSIRKYSKNYEILLIDNGSTTETIENYKNLSGEDITINTFPNTWTVSKSVNYGLSMAKGEYLIWANNDIILCPDWLEIMQQNCDKYNAISGAAGENVKFENNDIIKSNWIDWKMSDLPKECDYVGGGCEMFSRKVYETIGGLDENLNNYYTDLDYSLRAKQSGFISMVISLPGYQHLYGVTVKRIAGKNFGNVQTEKKQYIYDKHWKNK